MTNLMRTLLLAGLFQVAATPAFAQSTGDELDLSEFDDLTSKPQPTVADERTGLMDEAKAELAEPTVESKEKRRRRVIKTLQRKTFMKIGRTEVGLGAGLVTNDPFINRYIVRLDGTYHFTEVAAIQIGAGFSPNLGRGDWKGITKQIVLNNSVTPDISKIQFYGDVTLQYAPIYGKLAAPGNKIINFDIFGLIGSGIVQTADDLDALGCDLEDPACTDSASQIHSTLNYGGGIRVVFGKNIALRVEGRGISYIEVIESTNLEMKNNMLFMLKVSYFLGKSN